MQFAVGRGVEEGVLTLRTYFIFALLSKTSNRQETLAVFPRKNHTLFRGGGWGVGASQQGINRN